MEILFGSDSPFAPTGFAIQASGLAKRLAADGHRITYLGWQYQGSPISSDGYMIVGTIIGTPFGQAAYPKLFKTRNFDCMFTLGDCYMVDPIRRMPHPFWFGYFPLDGDPVPHYMQDTIRDIDCPIAMSQFGHNMLKRYNIDAQYIPHSVERKDFFKDEELGKTFRKLHKIPEDAFVVGSVSRFNPRKHIERLIYAFSIFAKDKDDAILYLHTDINDPLKNFNLLYYARMYGISKKLKYTDVNFMEGVPVQTLNAIYNCFDVHALATGGEGFGVPIVEAMMCGVPNIATSYTTPPEFLGRGRGLLVSPEPGGIVEQITDGRPIGVKKAWVSIDGFVEALNKLYDNKSLRTKISKRARTFALKKYTWETNYSKWKRLFDKVYSGVEFLK